MIQYKKIEREVLNQMERIAVFSDIHANLTALEAVMCDIKNRGINKVFCLGDIVYKGASPSETIDIVRKNCDVVIKGNCDEFMISDTALEKKYWTRMKIGEERAQYLKKLPVSYEFYLSGYLVRLFHACPFDLQKLYNPMYNNSEKVSKEIKNPEIMFENTEFIGKTKNDKTPDIVGYGHIHTPNVIRVKNKMIFNPGSVGMPTEMLNTDKIDETNKFTAMASYSILEGEYGKKELDTLNISIIRVPYDLNKEIDILKKSDNPQKELIIRKLQTAEP